MNMASWKITIFHRRYIFKCWVFHCHSLLFNGYRFVWLGKMQRDWVHLLSRRFGGAMALPSVIQNLGGTTFSGGSLGKICLWESKESPKPSQLFPGSFFFPGILRKYPGKKIPWNQPTFRSLETSDVLFFFPISRPARLNLWKQFDKKKSW